MGHEYTICNRQTKGHVMWKKLYFEYKILTLKRPTLMISLEMIAMILTIVAVYVAIFN